MKLPTLLFGWLFALAIAATPTHAQFDGTQRPTLELLEEQAKGGDLEAQFQLGLQLVTAQNGDKSRKAQGALWIQKAAKGGHAKAMHVLAALYEEGVGVAQDEQQSFSWNVKAAEKGIVEAQTGVALAYLTGKGVEKDPASAAEWAQKSAAQGHPGGQAMWGSMLMNGEGTPKNAAKGAVWFLRSAKQNHPFAQRQLAYAYYTGNGVPMDYKRCEAWYRRAIVSGADPWAMNDLAWFLSTCPDESFHKGPEAVALAKKAVRLLQDSEGAQRHEIIDTMAAALARSGQFSEAIVWQRRCVQLLAEDKDVTPEGRKKLETEFSTRLDLYKAKKTYADEPAKPEKKGELMPEDDVLDGPVDRNAAQPEPRTTAPKKKAP
jgi:TPR repeat protein